MQTSTSPAATLPEAPSIYTDGTYLAGNGSWHQEDSPWKAAHIKAILERNAIPFTSACEVGCGAGEILKVLSRTLGADKQLYGYEISPQAYEQLTREMKPDEIEKAKAAAAAYTFKTK